MSHSHHNSNNCILCAPSSSQEELAVCLWLAFWKFHFIGWPWQLKKNFLREQTISWCSPYDFLALISSLGKYLETVLIVRRLTSLEVWYTQKDHEGMLQGPWWKSPANTLYLINYTNPVMIFSPLNS